MQNVDKLALADRPGGASLAVKAVPGSSRDKLAGVLGDSLKVTVSAAPEKGKANQAIQALLAKALGLPPRRVQLLAGPTNPRKEFLIAGLSADQVRTKLKELSLRRR